MAGLPDVWGATAEEVAATYPCDELSSGPGRLLRAVGTPAPAADVYRWLCQLRVAPYSYDWIDNGGRTSPRRLVPGLDELAVGQRIASIFEVAQFTPDREITMTIRRGRLQQLFGPVVMTYRVSPAPGGSRLVGVLRIGRRRSGPLAPASRYLLSWGDLVMMRKQLRTLTRLAEQHGGGAVA